MTEAKVSDYILVTLVILSLTMLIWTVNILSSVNNFERTPITISAFNA